MTEKEALQIHINIGMLVGSAHRAMTKRFVHWMAKPEPIDGNLKREIRCTPLPPLGLMAPFTLDHWTTEFTR